MLRLDLDLDFDLEALGLGFELEGLVACDFLERLDICRIILLQKLPLQPVMLGLGLKANIFVASSDVNVTPSS